MKFKNFSIIQSYTSAINVFFSNLHIYCPIALFALFINTLFNFFIPLLNFDLLSTYYNYKKFGVVLSTNIIGSNIVFIVLYFLFYIFYQAALIKISLKVINYEDVSFKDFFKIDYNFGTYLGVVFLYRLFISIGLIFLIIPGVIIFTRYFFAVFCVLDKNLNLEQSFRESNILTKFVKLKILLFSFISVIFIGFVSGFPFSIIWVTTFGIPVLVLAETFIYKELLKYND